MRCLVEYASVLHRSGLIRLARIQQALELIFTVMVGGKHMEHMASNYFWIEGLVHRVVGLFRQAGFLGNLGGGKP